MVIELSVAGETGLDLAFQKAFLLRMREPPMALDRIGIRLLARDAEEMANDFGSLAHVQFGDGICQSALEPDDRLEIFRTRLQQRHDPCTDAFRAGEPRKPAHALRR